MVSVVKEDKNAKSENLDLNHQIEGIIEKRGGVWKCRICGKVSKTKTVLIDHAETHIEGSGQSCHLCIKTCRNRPALRSHIRYSHSELSFDCADCHKFGMNKITFKTHNQSKNHKVKRGETILVNFNFE